MICSNDGEITCPYNEEMLDNDPELCLYCDPDLFLFLEDDKK